MKKILFGLVVMIALASCTNHGKKVKIDGTKAEVYIKGDGVTEDDAKKAGDYLKREFLPSNEKEASMQLTREGDVYTMRFVYDKKVYDTLKNVEEGFKMIAAGLSKEVFGGKKVDIALADKHFKDYKNIPYDEAVAKRMETPEPVSSDDDTGLSKSDFDHDSAGDVDFYWLGISDEEAQRIADYIVSNGSFSGGTAEIYMTRENDRTVLRFPMIESARTDPAYLDMVSKVSKEIKDNVFADALYSFYVTDEMLNKVKAWDY
jgi:hypothetical protein